jgi:predicted nucleic acid-binding protein
LTTFALDTSALVAWVLQENQRWRAIDALLRSPHADPVLPAPGLTELIATVRRRGNSSSPQEITLALDAMNVRTELMTIADLIRSAELHELSRLNPGAVSPRSQLPATLSTVDTLILAVSERLGVPVVTLDRYWSDFANSGHTTVKVVQI